MNFLTTTGLKLAGMSDDTVAKIQDALPATAGLIKLYKDNSSTLTPDPLYVRFHYSHPPATERLAAMLALPSGTGHAAPANP